MIFGLGGDMVAWLHGKHESQEYSVQAKFFSRNIIRKTYLGVFNNDINKKTIFHVILFT